MPLKDLLPLTVRMRIADLRGRGLYSHYADAHHCIFIHIPKAAGSSVALTLFGQPSRHIPWQDYARANPRKFAQYFKFTFVRNPWDRLVSTWAFLRKGGMNEQDRHWADTVLCHYPDFDSFVHGWLSPQSIQSWVHFRPQHTFFCDAHGQAQVDFVGRFERLEQDFAVVAERLGCSRPLARVNASERGDYRRYYTPEMRRIVAEVYARDIELLGYDRDGE